MSNFYEYMTQGIKTFIAIGTTLTIILLPLNNDVFVNGFADSNNCNIQISNFSKSAPFQNHNNNINELQFLCLNNRYTLEETDNSNSSNNNRTLEIIKFYLEQNLNPYLSISSSNETNNEHTNKINEQKVEILENSEINSITNRSVDQKVKVFECLKTNNNNNKNKKTILKEPVSLVNKKITPLNNNQFYAAIAVLVASCVTAYNSHVVRSIYNHLTSLTKQDIISSCNSLNSLIEHGKQVTSSCYNHLTSLIKQDIISSCNSLNSLTEHGKQNIGSAYLTLKNKIFSNKNDKKTLFTSNPLESSKAANHKIGAAQISQKETLVSETSPETKTQSNLTQKTKNKESKKNLYKHSIIAVFVVAGLVYWMKVKEEINDKNDDLKIY